MSNNNVKTDYESIQGLSVPGVTEERSREERSSICSSGSRGYKIKRWLGVRRSTWLLSLYIIAYFVYLLGGCMMFAALETDLEESIKRDIHHKKSQFLERHPSVEPE